MPLSPALALLAARAKKTSEPAGSDAGSAKASSKKAVELQIFAANSLEKALPEVQELYTEQTGTTFADTQFKASGDLVEQMRAGATVDVLITASKGTMTTPRPPDSSMPTPVRICSSTTL